MRTVSTNAAAPAAAGLRLFSPTAADDSGPRIWPEMSLCEFFKAWVLPVAGKQCKWSPGTIKSYEEAVEHWSELTHNVGLAKIDDYEISRFVDGLGLQPGRSAEFLAPASQRKHCKAIQRLLSIAGPRSKRSKRELCRFGAGLIGEAPWIEAPDPADEPPDGDFTNAEIKAILEACKAMRTPKLKGVDPREWWRALVLFICATGLRISSVMQLEWDMLESSSLTLRVPGAICKKKRPDVKYVHPVAFAAIDAIRGPSPRIFAWPNWPRPGATRGLQRQRERLVAKAGLPAERQFGFHGFRKFLATELMDFDELAARDAMNHRDVSTTRKSYANGKRQETAKLRRMKAAIDQLPLFQ